MLKAKSAEILSPTCFFKGLDYGVPARHFNFWNKFSKKSCSLKKSSRVQAACKLLSLGRLEPNLSNNLFSHFFLLFFSATKKLEYHQKRPKKFRSEGWSSWRWHAKRSKSWPKRNLVLPMTSKRFGKITICLRFKI